MVKNILIGVVFVVVVWLSVGLVRIRIFTNRAADIIRSTTKFERSTKGQQSILVLGDSLAYGTGASRPELSVAGRIAAKYPDAKVTNLGANGKRTNQLAGEMGSITEKHDLIVIIVGGNDIMRPWIDLKTSAKHLDSIYGEAASKGTRVIALTTGDFRYTSFFLWPLNHYYSLRSSELRDAAKKTAEKHDNVTYIDMVTYNQKVAFDALKEAPDHLHLSDDGTAYWLGAIEAAGALPATLTEN